MIANIMFWIFIVAMVASIIVLAVRKTAKDMASGNYHYSVLPGVPLVYSMGAGAVIVAMLLAVFAIGSITGFFEYYQITLPIDL